LLLSHPRVSCSQSQETGSYLCPDG
jgi:hypothetical protein